MQIKRMPIAVALTLMGLAAFAAARSNQGTDVAIQAHIVKPRQVEASAERIASLTLPPGFRISVFADGLEKPRMLAVAPDGSVYVTRREPGDAWLLQDTDDDGRADVGRKVAEKKDLHGIAIDDQDVYLVSSEELLATRREADGSFGPLTTLASDLPAGGQHNNRTVGIGPDRKLYVSVGSTCNACDETTEESATLLQFERDGSGRRIFARGLRNTIGFAWDPRTGQLWGMDHGIDWLGDDEQREELNRIEDGQQYGWPYIFADSKPNPTDEPPDGLTHAEWAELSREPSLLHTAHSAPMQMAFYTGDRFPETYRNGAFLALHGSWNRKPPSGYEVVFVRFDDRGTPVTFEPFLSGFLSSGSDGAPALFGRPCGVAIGEDGALLISDDANGVIYRVDYQPSRDPEAEQ
jgi:glucose/arabinose dehydrogenase